MPYVERDAQGKIAGIYAKFQRGIAEEFVADAVLPDPVPPTNTELLNLNLIQKGSIVRALAMVMFQEVNKLRVKNGDPAYTLAQFKTALTNEMDG